MIPLVPMAAHALQHSHVKTLLMYKDLMKNIVANVPNAIKKIDYHSAFQRLADKFVPSIAIDLSKQALQPVVAAVKKMTASPGPAPAYG